ncbi:hypothetical protein T484DRAFT_1770740 [Baffinella frigidus]|nr:hypothetical protein T484DRAFT_1770740 [Cryptophyta sp. CCMP2293]
MGISCRCDYCMGSRRSRTAFADASQEIRVELAGGEIVGEPRNHPHGCTNTKLKIVKALHAKAKEYTDGNSTVASKPQLNEWFKAISPLPVERLMEIAPGKWAEEGRRLEAAQGDSDAFDAFDGTVVQWPPLVGLIDDDAWYDLADDQDVTEMIRLIAPEILENEDQWCLVGPDSPPPAAPERPSFHDVLSRRGSAPTIVAAFDGTVEQWPALAEEESSDPATEEAESVEKAVVENVAEETPALALGVVDEAPYTGEPKWWGRHIGAEKKSRGHREKVSRATERRATQRSAAVC